MNTRHHRQNKGAKKSKMMLLVLGATAAALTQGARLTQHVSGKGINLAQQDLVAKPPVPNPKPTPDCERYKIIGNKY